MMQTVFGIEEQGWRALSSPGNAGREFYRGALRDDAVMLLPGGIRLFGKEEILASLAAQPWQTFKIEEPRQIALDDAVTVLVYKVSAIREGATPYTALVSSTYTKVDGTWKLAVHQQTPA